MPAGYAVVERAQDFVVNEDVLCAITHPESILRSIAHAQYTLRGLPCVFSLCVAEEEIRSFQ
jgi:hypothetical protein